MGKYLQQLGEAHKTAARLKFEGHTSIQIANELNVTVRRVHLWFSDPLMKEEVQRLSQQVEEIFVERMATAGVKAIEAVTEMLSMPPQDPDISHGQRLEAAVQMMDRIPSLTRVVERGGPSPESGGDVNYTAIFHNMPDGKLADLLKGWADDSPTEPPLIEQ